MHLFSVAMCISSTIQSSVSKPRPVLIETPRLSSDDTKPQILPENKKSCIKTGNAFLGHRTYIKWDFLNIFYELIHCQVDVYIMTYT